MVHIKKIVIFLFIFSLAFHHIHPFYISVFEIDYQESEKELQITIHVFIDDFEKALKQNNNQKKIRIIENDSITAHEISTYIQNHLLISLDKKLKIPLKLLGYEIKKESLLIYLFRDNVLPFHSLEIQTNFLYQLDNSQTNVFHVKRNGKLKSSKISFPEQNLIFTF